LSGAGDHARNRVTVAGPRAPAGLVWPAVWRRCLLAKNVV